MDTHAVKDGDEWINNGEKTWNTGIHKADCDLICENEWSAGDGDGSPFLVPTNSRGFEIFEYLDFNMPTDHAHIRLTDVRHLLRNIQRG